MSPPEGNHVVDLDVDIQPSSPDSSTWQSKRFLAGTFVVLLCVGAVAGFALSSDSVVDALEVTRHEENSRRFAPEASLTSSANRHTRRSPTNQPIPAPPTNQPNGPPTNQPNGPPTNQPNGPTDQPTQWPTDQPTQRPTDQPTQRPTDLGANRPTNTRPNRPTNTRPNRTTNTKPNRNAYNRTHNNRHTKNRHTNTCSI
eukprot:TRINITY_DN916_c0_g1_i5.p2 TRINITY_DN916_c0_g1~~TRINITY_DN916_c0_g1_i5.p2  ORF type:complete len:199 (+),score=22.27 TRINITY_DN916_c0_g1_i5:154-750(+)